MTIKPPLPALINRTPSSLPTIILHSPNPFRSHRRRPPDLHTCVSHLQLCAHHRHLPKAREVHAWLLAAGLHASPFALTSLINLYSKCGHPADALAVFRSASAPQPAIPIAWNAMVSGLASTGLPSDALHLFRRMRREAGVRPDEFTYPCAVKACADLGDPDGVRRIHADLFKVDLDRNIFTSSALIHSYLKLGFEEDAGRVFDELPVRDVVLWNAMVNGFARMGRFTRALAYFRRMGGEGLAPSKFTVTGILSVLTATADLPGGREIHAFIIKVGYGSDVVISNSLIDMYGKCLAVDDAAAVFEAMAGRDNFSWNSILSASEYNGDHGGTLRLFGHMLSISGVRPDAITIASVLPACAQMAALKLGREIHGHMITSGIDDEDVFVSNALMDMYAKSGSVEDARRVFDGMGIRDVVSWNIMIDGYAAHGQGWDAVQLFESMRESGVAANGVTFLAVLTACSHAGLVELGKEILWRMDAEFGVAPMVEHYSCAVDLLGRAGLLDEAHEMAVRVGAEAGVWRAYLAACWAHGETERAVEAAERVVEMTPGESGGYVLLSNTHGWAGRFGDVSEARREMRRRRVRKTPGCSWVEVAGSGVHAFVTGDRTHRQAEDIYRALQGLMGWLRECDDS